MKRIALTLFLLGILISSSFAQTWVTAAPNIYYNSGNVGIATTNPTAALQLGDFNGAPQSLLIPGVYNFEQVRLGQISNGNAALEFVNHNGGASSYGIKLLVDVDHGAPGLQFQYASPASSYSALSYSTGLYMNLSGNVGIGTTSPAGKLDVQGGNASIYNNGGPTVMVIGASAVGKTSLSFSTSADASGYGIIQSIGVYGSTYGNTIINPNGGNVGIGTAAPGSYRLAVNGGIHSQSVNVDLTGWSDYVLKKEYQLPSLTEVKTYIDQNHRLPDMPSEKDVIKDGINLGEMNKLLTKKVEELTLYLIDKDAQLKAQQQEISQQQKNDEKLNVRVREQQLQIDEQKSANLLLQKEIDELKQQFMTLSKSSK